MNMPFLACLVALSLAGSTTTFAQGAGSSGGGKNVRTVSCANLILPFFNKEERDLSLKSICEFTSSEINCITEGAAKSIISSKLESCLRK